MSDLAILGGTPVRTRPFPTWPQHTGRDRTRLMSVLDSGNWGGYPFPNRLAKEFAEKFAAHQGASYGCAIANGTIALVAALRAIGLRFGDEVIVPAYTWDGTAAAVLFAGGVPVFADVDPDTYCLDVKAARHAVTRRTKAIIPVHLAMRFTDMDALAKLAVEHNLRIVEDCAHAHGAQYKGRGAGSIGDLGCFSMQSSKLMTSGEGGAVITSDLRFQEMIESLVNCGRASQTDRYEQRILGSNYRITEFQAALLLGQLERLPELTERRAHHAKLLSEGLASIRGVRPLPPQHAITREAIYCYIFQYRPEVPRVPRDMFAAALEAEGIPCDGRFYEPVYRSDLFPADTDTFPQLKLGRENSVEYRDYHCPVAERAAYEESVWLPQFVLLGSDDDVADIVRAVEKVMANAEALASADPGLARVKSMSRAQRPHVEDAKNY